MNRILHVLGSLNRGGAETMVMNLYRNIDRTKVQFDFIVHTNKMCDYTDEIKMLGGKIYSLPKYTGKNHLQYKKAWNDFFSRYKEYHIIHGHVRSTASIYLKIAKQHNLTTISHSHSISSGKGLSAVVKNVLQYPIRNISDYLLACSEVAGIWLFGEKSIQNSNYHILNNAIDAKKFTFNEAIRLKIRKELSVEDKLVLGHVGGFRTEKNHLFLVDVFKKVHDQNKNTLLMLVGDGPLNSRIKDKVNELGLSDSVIFTGVRSDIPNLLQAMDIFVFPSLFEGLGMAVIEAQGSGLKCIVSDSIPKEAFVTDLVQSVPLESTLDVWSNTIIENLEYKRRITYDEICEKEYDIVSTAKWLEKFYLSLSKVDLITV